MGENEQGGMLRVVVVLGLIALIAAVVIGGVVYAKNNMQSRIVSTVSLVDKGSDDDTPADEVINESDVPEDAWHDVTDIPSQFKAKAGQHVAIRYLMMVPVNNEDSDVQKAIHSLAYGPVGNSLVVATPSGVDPKIGALPMNRVITQVSVDDTGSVVDTSEKVVLKRAFDQYKIAASMTDSSMTFDEWLNYAHSNNNPILATLVEFDDYADAVSAVANSSTISDDSGSYNGYHVFESSTLNDSSLSTQIPNFVSKGAVDAQWMTTLDNEVTYSFQDPGVLLKMSLTSQSPNNLQIAVW